MGVLCAADRSFNAWVRRIPNQNVRLYVLFLSSPYPLSLPSLFKTRFSFSSFSNMMVDWMIKAAQEGKMEWLPIMNVDPKVDKTSPAVPTTTTSQPILTPEPIAPSVCVPHILNPPPALSCSIAYTYHLLFSPL